jgi:hypothetical protein
MHNRLVVWAFLRVFLVFDGTILASGRITPLDNDLLLRRRVWKRRHLLFYVWDFSAFTYYIASLYRDSYTVLTIIKRLKQ